MTEASAPFQSMDGRGQAVQNLVYNTTSGKWELEQQGVLEAVSSNLYVAVDELEDLVQAAPVDRSNSAFALSYTGDNLTQVDMTVESVVYRKTLTYSGSTLTGVSAWVEQ